MKFTSDNAERQRLANFRWARAAVRKCLREHTVREYLPGQVVYNLGEYPKPFSIRPTDYDLELLKLLAHRGVELIQIHEDWNDSQRVLGADKFTSHDPEGLHEFVDAVHDLGMKIIPYISTGYFEATDPDFREEWAGPGHLVELPAGGSICCRAWSRYSTSTASTASTMTRAIPRPALTASRSTPPTSRPARSPTPPSRTWSAP